MKLKMLYDDAFKRRFPNTNEAINDILVHLKTFFMAEGLGTKITLDVDPKYESVGTTLLANGKSIRYVPKIYSVNV